MKQRDTETTTLLNELYQNCLQREAEYRFAFREAQDSDLKYLFSSYSLQRGKLARELGAALAVMGMSRESRQPDSAEIERTGRSSRALLDDCICREEAAVELYRDALAEELSETLRALLTRQVGEIEVIRERLRQLHSLAQPT